MPLAQTLLLKQDELPSGDAAHFPSASAGPRFWWEPLDMYTAQTIFLCFNVEYIHHSIFPVTSGSGSSSILLGIHSPLSERQWTTQMLNWTLTATAERLTNQMVELFARSGEKQPKHCPLKSNYTQTSTQMHAVFKYSFLTDWWILSHIILSPQKKRLSIHLIDRHPSRNTRVIQKYEQIVFSSVF